MNYANCIIYACAAFAAGIWLAGIHNWHIPTLAVLAAVLLVSALRQVRRKEQLPNHFWPVIGLFLVAGMMHQSQGIVLPADDISRYAGRTITMEGVVDEVPEVNEAPEGRQVKYLVRVETVKTERVAAVPASGKVRLYVLYKDNTKPAAYGNRIMVYGKVLELHGYNNPGQIDVTMALKRQNITARLAAQSKDLKIVYAPATYYWRAHLVNWQTGIVQAMQKIMPASDAGVLTAVLFGGYQNISGKVLDDFATTGLIHILSVSGAHIALVAGLMRWLGTRMHLGLWTSAALAISAITLYAVMSGLTPPVIRSAAMGFISLAAGMMNRENYAPAALAVTALIMLVWQPLLVYDISFQLSLGATAGLVFLYPKTLTALGKIPAWLAGPLAVTVGAQLGVLPFIAWYFNNFSLISFLANMIVLPGVELLIILGLAGVMLYTVMPAIGAPVFVICSLMIGGITQLTALLAAVPYSSVYIPSGGLRTGAAYYLGLAWLYGWRPLALPGPGQLLGRWPKSCALTIVLAGVILLAVNWLPNPLTVHFIDVGQGDSTLVITPHGRAVLIDTGGSYNSAAFDMGERVVAPYLKHYGVTVIDYLILTHGHQDHAGGAAGVAANIKVNNIMLAREAYSPPVRALLRSGQGAAVIPTYTGQAFALDGVLFTIIHTTGSSMQNGETATGNEVSSVIRVSYGHHSFLVTGDLEARGEAELLAEGVSPSTVLKVGHHGSKTSTTPLFLQAVNPSFAVISAGYNNRFGHPHPETLARLNATKKTRIYRTDKQGAIVFRSDGTSIVADTYIK